MCVSSYMLLKIRVGRYEYFFSFFEIILFAFSVCHMMSQLVAPSLSLANSLISADVLSAVRKRYKNTFSKICFN